jgi:hypothetical protein
MLQYQKRFMPSLPVSLAPTREIRMEVVFGTPSQNCIGSGVCMVMNRLPSHRTLHCPHAPAWISFDQDKVLFRFLKTEVVREDAVRRFDSPWFLVQEPFEIPRLTARSLGMSSNRVCPGVYTVEERAGDWVIAFNLYA